MALIEIDGVPKKMVIFHGKLLNNQRVYIYIHMYCMLIVLGRGAHPSWAQNIHQAVHFF